MRVLTYLLAAAISVTLMVLVLALASAGPSSARVKGDMFCWVSDSEFPVACDEDDDD